MSYTYGFFDAVDLGSGNYDRVYSSAEFSHYWALLVGDGVFGRPSTSLNVLATAPVAMSVKVASGTGWIKGHYLTVPDNMDEVIAVPVANPSLPRIDSIIMALNNTDRDMKLYVRSGTAAASPKAVTLQRDADVWELELAQITVAAGNITQQAIKDMRTDPDRCGIVTGLIDQFDVSGFLTAAQESFDEWFENVKSQLGDDVAGNLLNLIQGLQTSKLDVSAKASTSEATAGTNDTKYMTPLKTKQAIGTAAETVLDLTTGKLINVQSVFEKFTLSPLSIKLHSQSDGNSTDDREISGTYGIGVIFGNTIFNGGVLSKYQSDWKSSTILLQTPLTPLTPDKTPSLVKNWGEEYSNGSDTRPGVNSTIAVSSEGDILALDKYCILDMSSKKVSPAYGSSYLYGVYGTSGYWGYLYLRNETLIVFYLKRSTTSGSFSQVSVAGNWSDVQPIGVRGNKLYLLGGVYSHRNITQYQVITVDFTNSTPMVTTGVTTFDITRISGGQDLYMRVLFHDANNCYIIARYRTSSSESYQCFTRAVRFSMVNHTSNWAELTTGNTELSDWINAYYCGTVNNKAVMGRGSSGQQLLVMDKTNENLSILSIPTSFIDPSGYYSIRERVFAIPDLPGALIAFGNLIYPEKGEVVPLIWGVSGQEVDRTQGVQVAQQVLNLSQVTHFAGTSITSGDVIGMTGQRVAIPGTNQDDWRYHFLSANEAWYILKRKTGGD
jgi:hypothetical protein